MLFLKIETAFIILIFTHILFAGINVYWLCRQNFNLEIFPSSFAAVVYAVTPMMFSHLEAGHYSMIIAFSWLPLFGLWSYRFLKQPNLKTSFFLSIISWIIYINYINISFFSLLFFIVYSFHWWLQNQSAISIKLYLKHYLIFLSLFLGLISPNLLAQIEITPLTNRNLITFSDVAQPIWSFKLFIKNLTLPFHLNTDQFSTERVIFPGIIIWLLFFYGISSKQKDRCFFVAWLGFSLLFILGNRIPFFIFFYKYFPLIKLMRIPVRMWIISLALIIIPFSAVGLQRLYKKNHQKVLSAILAIVAILELLSINHKIFSRPLQKNLLPESFYKLISQDPIPDNRVYCTTGCFSLQKLGELGVNSLSGNNPIQLTASTQFLQLAAGYNYSNYIPILPPYPVFKFKPQPSAKLLAQANTKYIASPYKLSDSNFKQILNQNNFFLYKNLLASEFDNRFYYQLQSPKISLIIFTISIIVIFYANSDLKFFYRKGGKGSRSLRRKSSPFSQK